jgi:hypothetical protein
MGRNPLRPLLLCMIYALVAVTGRRSTLQFHGAGDTNRQNCIVKLTR